MGSDDLRDIMRIAHDNLVHSGSLVPVLFVNGREPAVVAFQDMPSTSDKRRAAFYALGRRLAHLKPQRVISVMDAYYKSADVELPLERSLADDPAAEECIVVASLDRRGRARMLVWPYERHPTLEGLEIEFKPIVPFRGKAEVYLLEAFFEGVASAGSKGKAPNG